jgi:hypothetical protein
MINKNRFLTSLILIIISVSLLLVKNDLLEVYFEFRSTVYPLASFLYTITSLIIGLFGATRIVFDYLQGSISTANTENLSEINKKMNALEEFKSSFEKEIKIDNNTKQIILEKVSALTNDEILKNIENKYGENIFQKYKLNIIIDELKNIKYRFDIDMRRISRTSSINLALGFATTIFAITYLIYSLLLTDQTTTLITYQIQKNTDVNIILALFLVKFLPRLSVSIFIELFSFFFLKMYKKNLDDIKYLNNERTNVELKLLSLNTAIINEDDETLSLILIELSKTERNFILKNGESTVEVEKNKLENSVYKDTLDSLSKILKK